MMHQILPSTNERLRLKESTGWFAAGKAFRRALALLSDGAFRLFTYICLEADRRNGRIQATHKDLASTLGKSKRSIGTYIAELESKGICLLKPGKNQFAATVFEITDSYWPYHREADNSKSPEQMATCHNGNQILGVEGAAKVLEAHPNSIRRWANAGRLRCFLDVNGWRKFKMEDILKFKDELERLV